MIEKKLNIEGYCIDCKIDNHCINCPYMDELEYYHDWTIKTIKKEEPDLDKNKVKYIQRVCGCGQNIIGNYPMCKECYWKSNL